MGMSEKAPTESLPRRLGRYEVVLPIATGVSSTILLGCREGQATSSSRQPVAIKRIDPSLTRDGDVEAFLGDARKVTTMRHANVVEVREVGRDNRELFLISEYLEGENTAKLLHKLDVQRRTLDYGIAAYVAAEAAAALDAAHDHGIVHEHLTPYDVFVGYDGTIKVLDLGIASALDRMTKATTISERELPYSSPERCKDDVLDRRSDVFSLGAILWEMMTGMSPFERSSPADTIRAILSEDPRLPPPRILRSLPVRLSEITMRALSRDPGKRYESAGALRQELLTFIGELPMAEQPAASLGKVMQSLFGQRIEDTAELLRNFQSHSSAEIPAAAPVPSDPSVFDRETVLAPDDLAAAATPSETVVDESTVPVTEAPAVTATPSEAVVLDSTLLLTDEPAAVTEVAAPTILDPTTVPVAEEPAEETVAAPEPSSPALPERVMVPVADEPATVQTRDEVAAPWSDAQPRTEVDSEEYAVPAGSRPAKRRALVLLVVGALVAVGTVGIILSLRSPQSSADPVSVARAEGSTASTAPPPAVPTSSSSPSIRGVTAASTGDTQHQAQTTLTIDTVPAKATVVIGGETKGTSPIDLKLTRSREPLIVEIRRAGYQTLKEQVVPDVDQRLRLTLVPALPAARPTTTPSPTSKPTPTSNPYHRFD